MAKKEQPRESDVFKAIADDDKNELREILGQNPELAEARNEEGLSAVLFARYNFKLNALNELLKAKPQLSLFDAAAVGNAARARELLETNRSLAESYTPDGFTALHLAAFFGHAAVAKVLLEHDASVNAISKNVMNVMPLHSAVAGGHHEVSKLLLETGADANASQQGGYTPLHEAAQNGDEKTARLLLDNGADKTLKLESGQTPARLAERHGHKQLAEAIRDYEP